MRAMGLQSPEEHVVGVLVDEHAAMNGYPRIFEVCYAPLLLYYRVSGSLGKWCYLRMSAELVQTI